VLKTTLIKFSFGFQL